MKLRDGDPEEAGMSAERIRRLSGLAKGWVDQGMTPSLVVLVARKGVVVLHEAFGKLTPEPGAPPLPKDAIYPIASISKLFTATAAMILVDDGLLGLHRPVQEYMPEFVGQGKDAVMVHHLLTHTSGLRGEDLDELVRRKLGSGEIQPSPDAVHPGLNEFPALQYFSQTHDAPLSYRPGAEMSYCGYGYRLLAEIIARVSGSSLAEFAQARILGPLGLGDTFYGLPDGRRARQVRRGPEAPLTLLDDPTTAPCFAGMAGMFSTARDLAAFGRMILNRGQYGAARIVSAASVAEMTRNQVPGVPGSYRGEVFPESSWGLGWDVHGTKRSLREASLFSPRAVRMGGGGGTNFWVDPEHELVGAYLSVQVHPGGKESSPGWRADVFVDAATAAIVEP
jgi:CubicO group peptidase (beta-lactamase class C family)